MYRGITHYYQIYFAILSKPEKQKMLQVRRNLVFLVLRLNRIHNARKNVSIRHYSDDVIMNEEFASQNVLM